MRLMGDAPSVCSCSKIVEDSDTKIHTCKRIGESKEGVSRSQTSTTLPWATGWSGNSLSPAETSEDEDPVGAVFVSMARLEICFAALASPLQLLVLVPGWSTSTSSVSPKSRNARSSCRRWAGGREYDYIILQGDAHAAVHLRMMNQLIV
jgi:hypothetical protein